MVTEIPDLWSDDIRVDVLPPAVILRAQDAAIGRKTQGMLRAEVRTDPEEEEVSDPERRTQRFERHTLDLLAPALGYRETVLEVVHPDDRMYPATIQMPEAIHWSTTYRSPIGRANTAEEFIRLLGVALQSAVTRATIDTLLARSNVARLERAKPGGPA